MLRSLDHAFQYDVENNNISPKLDQKKWPFHMKWLPQRMQWKLRKSLWISASSMYTISVIYHCEFEIIPFELIFDWMRYGFWWWKIVPISILLLLPKEKVQSNTISPSLNRFDLNIWIFDFNSHCESQNRYINLNLIHKNLTNYLQPLLEMAFEYSFFIFNVCCDNDSAVNS